MREIKFEIKIPNIKFSSERKFQLKAVLSLLVVVGVFIVKQNFDFTFVGALILAYFGLSLIWKLDSRISAALALFFLIATPVLLMLKNDVLAETSAIYAYYFLVITVAQLIFELKTGQIVAKRPVPRTNFALASSPSTKGAGARLVRGVDNFPEQLKRKIV
ncbi:MAG: hypothetical protein WC608_01315 [Parcubacteria group bacterium]